MSWLVPAVFNRYRVDWQIQTLDEQRLNRNTQRNQAPKDMWWATDGVHLNGRGTTTTTNTTTTKQKQRIKHVAHHRSNSSRSTQETTKQRSTTKMMTLRLFVSLCVLFCLIWFPCDCGVRLCCVVVLWCCGVVVCVWCSVLFFCVVVVCVVLC